MQIHKKVRTISRRIEAYALDQTLYVTHQNPSETILANIGFQVRCVDQSILPNPIGKESFENTEGKIIIRKDLPKETIYRSIYRSWDHTDWHGNTHHSSGYYLIPYNAYPREHTVPNELHFNLIDVNGELIVYIGPLSMNDPSLIKDAVNLTIEFFGNCNLSTDLTPSELITQQLPWEILPPGENPWPKIHEVIIKSKFPRKAQVLRDEIFQSRIDLLESFNPNFKATGKNGYSGYVIFGYQTKNLFVLESLFQNNATYIFRENWEYLSQLTKAQILSNQLHDQRIIHTPQWKNELAARLR